MITDVVRGLLGAGAGEPIVAVVSLVLVIWALESITHLYKGMLRLWR